MQYQQQTLPTTSILDNITNAKKPSVIIDGDKSCFVSKAAVDKFKQLVKNTSEFNLDELSNKYIKPEYKLELVQYDNSEYKFKIITKLIEKSDKDKKQELLRAKINLMSKSRTNITHSNTKSAGKIDNEILIEYNKLKKISQMPIPEPTEILENPDQYKPIISMVLGNSMMKQLGKSHPYVRYFTLLAEKLGATEFLPIPTQDFSSSAANLPNNIEEMIKKSGPIELTQVKSNIINTEDVDTEDTEDEDDDIEDKHI